MKLIKSLFVVSLAALIGTTSAYAETNTKTTKQAKQQQTAKQQKAKKQAKKKNAPLTDAQALDLFNKSIGIRLVARDLITNKDGSKSVSLVYDIENRGDKGIKSVNWVNVYAVDKTIFHQQGIPLQFEKPFASKAKFRINLELAVNSLSKEAQAIFSDPNQRISSVTVARQIVFADGKKVDIKN